MTYKERFWNLYDSSPTIGNDLEDILYELDLELRDMDDLENTLTESDYAHALQIYERRNGKVVTAESLVNFIKEACEDLHKFQRIDDLHSIGRSDSGIRIKTGGKIYSVVIKEEN